MVMMMQISITNITIKLFEILLLIIAIIAIIEVILVDDWYGFEKIILNNLCSRKPGIIRYIQLQFIFTL